MSDQDPDLEQPRLSGFAGESPEQTALRALALMVEYYLDEGDSVQALGTLHGGLALYALAQHGLVRLLDDPPIRSAEWTEKGRALLEHRP